MLIRWLISIYLLRWKIIVSQEYREYVLCRKQADGDGGNISEERLPLASIALATHAARWNALSPSVPRQQMILAEHVIE